MPGHSADQADIPAQLAGNGHGEYHTAVARRTWSCRVTTGKHQPAMAGSNV